MLTIFACNISTAHAMCVLGYDHLLANTSWWLYIKGVKRVLLMAIIRNEIHMNGWDLSSKYDRWSFSTRRRGCSYM